VSSSPEITTAHFRLIGRAVKRFGWPIYPLGKTWPDSFSVLNQRLSFWYNSPDKSTRIEQEPKHSDTQPLKPV
jgi:hypothetical protein